VSAPLRLLLAGLGARGRYWRTVIEREPRAAAAAFVDPSPAARAAFAELEPDVPAFADLASALDAVAVDALVLATPPDTRDEHLDLACGRGLPLLVEKPLALDLGDRQALRRTRRTGGRPAHGGPELPLPRRHAADRAAAGLRRRGPPEFARFTYERWRDGHRPGINRYPLTMVHPMLWEQSIHHFDLLRFVYGAEPESVYARTFNPSWSMYR
jgi:predicted dehydrogenase